MSFKIKFISILILLVLFACREKLKVADDTGVSPEYPELISGQELSLILSDLKIYINENGEVYQPFRSFTLNGWPGQIFNSGLWMSGIQDGEIRVNAAGVTQSNISSNYHALGNNTRGNIYYFTPSSLETMQSVWPQEAPKDNLNRFLVYGSEMCWANLSSSSASEIGMYAKPFNSIKISQSLFSVDERNYEQVFFIKYNIKNESENDITEFYLGYYNDSDINFQSPNNDLAGYDSVWQVSYIYSRERDPQFSQYFGCGTLILQTPTQSGTEVQLTSNRYISRDDSTEFGEFALTPHSVFYALQGLDNNGIPMKNPVTGEETKFALTGNPVIESGWNDVSRDARILISVGPFNLQRGKSAEFTVAIFIENGNTLESLINTIKLKASQIILNRQTWE
jgi:hypothetical protein